MGPMLSLDPMISNTVLARWRTYIRDNDDFDDGDEDGDDENGILHTKTHTHIYTNAYIRTIPDSGPHSSNCCILLGKFCPIRINSAFDITNATLSSSSRAVRSRQLHNAAMTMSCSWVNDGSPVLRFPAKSRAVVPSVTV